MPEMTAKDIDAACQALADWFDSQDIGPENAARVMTVLLTATIHEVALERGLNPKDGGRIITDIIMAALP